jgi:AcrR family transcriptional regulator
VSTAATTTAARGADRRAQLVAAAATLFAERGYESVSVEDVAAAAGVTGPGVYRHFDDKQALLAEVVLAGVGLLEQRSAAALAPVDAAQDSDQGAAPAGGRVPALLAELVTLAVARPAAAVVWRWTGGHLAPADQREVARRAHVLLTTWGDAVRVQRPELTAADAELLCWAVMSVLGSTTVHRTRIGSARARDLLRAAGGRVLGVQPGAASPPLPPPAPLRTPGSRREQILEASSRLFAERGYHAVGIDDIGAAVGIAGPSVYRHFPSKVSVLVAVCQRAAERLALGVLDALRVGRDAHDVLRRLVGSYVDALLVSPDLRVGMSTDRTAVTGTDRDGLRRSQRELVAHWVRAEREVHPELAAADAAVLVHAGLTVANDLARTRSVAGRPGLRAELVALVLAVLDVPSTPS